MFWVQCGAKSGYGGLQYVPLYNIREWIADLQVLLDLSY